MIIHSSPSLSKSRSPQTLASAPLASGGRGGDRAGRKRRSVLRSWHFRRVPSGDRPARRSQKCCTLETSARPRLSFRALVTFRKRHAHPLNTRQSCSTLSPRLILRHIALPLRKNLVVKYIKYITKTDPVFGTVKNANKESHIGYFFHYHLCI